MELLLNHRESMTRLSSAARKDRLAFALMNAVNIPHETITNRLLQEGADIQHRPFGIHFDSWSVLWRATGTVPLSMMQKMLHYNPEINEQFVSIISIRGDIEILQELFQNAEDRGILMFDIWFTAAILAVQLG